MKSFLTRLFLIAMPFLMGILFLVFGIRNHLLGNESENWPTVKGKLAWETNTQAKKNKNISVSYQY